MVGSPSALLSTNAYTSPVLFSGTCTVWSPPSIDGARSAGVNVAPSDGVLQAELRASQSSRGSAATAMMAKVYSVSLVRPVTV